jgi:CheY-like chemotaxis protein
MSAHILVVEDELEPARPLLKGLRNSGYTIDHAAESRAPRQCPESRGFDELVEAAQELPRRNRYYSPNTRRSAPIGPVIF